MKATVDDDSRSNTSRYKVMRVLMASWDMPLRSLATIFCSLSSEHCGGRAGKRYLITSETYLVGEKSGENNGQKSICTPCKARCLMRGEC
ncbi:hypothetical protein TNCV_1587061 [Trichonephila clavipes]|nr:hypothetical protein TNCV_1587061 [Trichonephila clavipes]